VLIVLPQQLSNIVEPIMLMSSSVTNIPTDSARKLSVISDSSLGDSDQIFSVD